MVEWSAQEVSLSWTVCENIFLHELSLIFPNRRMHEMYDAPPGMWEATYVNYGASGLGATSYPSEDENGQIVWKSALAVQGKTARTSLGRMGKSDGTDNDKRARKWWHYLLGP